MNRALGGDRFHAPAAGACKAGGRKIAGDSTRSIELQRACGDIHGAVDDTTIEAGAVAAAAVARENQRARTLFHEAMTAALSSPTAMPRYSHRAISSNSADGHAAGSHIDVV